LTALPDHITITELARRSGVAASALRYYESLGLIAANRTAGNRRRYRRSVLRRVAVIKVAQSLGVSLGEVGAALARLPNSRDPTPADWNRLSGAWRAQLTGRIDTLARLRDQLSSCIGCGCLSLDRCGLFNARDGAGRSGAGPRYLLGDAPPAPAMGE
jgi:MerR family redox-sensitive transcriptional activator SoxR